MSGSREYRPSLLGPDAISFLRPNKGAGRFQKELVYHVEKTRVYGISGRYREGAYRFDATTHALIVGDRMEQIDEKLNEVNAEVTESRKILRELSDQVRTISDTVQPLLEQKTAEIRSLRMALIGELNQSLTSLREVRKFFLESNYQVEMDRLERFVMLCKEIQKLKADGTFDAVCDIAIRMAVQEVKQ